jgi:hypothetical protein
MARPLTDTAHPGAHPTMGEFAALLERWGFKPVRTHQPDQHHRTMRGPHGGRVQVLASLQGRADAVHLARAARLVQVDLNTFLAGPASSQARTAVRDATGTTPEPPGQQLPEPTPDAGRGTTRTRARAPRDRQDSVVALVLTTHARHDRPMRFEEIVDQCGGRVTRLQVSEASAHLCRTGQLDRICDGVYQWARGTRQQSVAPGPIRPTVGLPPLADAVAPAQSQNTIEPVDELFARLFPDGVRMTPKLLRDLQQWTELTRALAAHASS